MTYSLAIGIVLPLVRCEVVGQIADGFRAASKVRSAALPNHTKLR